MDKNKIVSIVVVIVVLVVLGFLMFKGDGKLRIGGEEKVATVNGVAITKTSYDTQLATAVASYKAQGINTDDATQLAQIKAQVLNDLINNELVNQGIVSAGIKVNDEDVEKQFADITTQAGGAENLKAELVKVNMTEQKLRENIAKQFAIQMYLEANIDTKSIVVSNEEVTQFYNDYKAAQVSASSTIKVPAEKELADQIKQQIIANKQQTMINDFLTTLRSKSEIVLSE
ncbi:MAG: hypothetical protein A2566_00635 [Candidatus Zambryskibacteria bacterium RIFOXYD1_FULL_40_13]|nr:MAG: hypothetical protein UT25_C0001G0111 [Parcubacteria group bacterium GW2011_GWC1_39_12]KKR19635.1 MAG: hypothetical protein UT49_C0001G0111 [Parcubacteria group bacterium GW2011_GWF1_39_37]KKR35790.1 MAG: hypothetical protein UT68_C0001G0113 [Parcubacteria group bacterium GW2011_GWC2_40_10]KKR52603.1 MAG: hypothetical protein UT89_C0001G0111 [Parcubacteria group bacterium GW2011_GWE1_40_20]KKR66055.1 MAG: hypothetical protein UU06_C0006G0006 [Parcubacteria group bacterium GW2011_GWB1_40_